ENNSWSGLENIKNLSQIDQGGLTERHPPILHPFVRAERGSLRCQRRAAHGCAPRPPFIPPVGQRRNHPSLSHFPRNRLRLLFSGLLTCLVLSGCSGNDQPADRPAGLKIYRHSMDSAPTSLDP